MKTLVQRLLFCTLALCALPALAGPWDVVVEQRNGSDNGQNTFVMEKPAASANGVMYWNGGTQQPGYVTLGTGLSITSGVLNGSAAVSPSQASASRSLNSAFQVHATRPALAFYSVQCTVTASISGGQNCDIIFEVASDSGFTANVQTLSICGDGQTYTLAVALQGVQPTTKMCAGWVPAGYYARLRTVQNTGTPSFSYRAGQEVLF